MATRSKESAEKCGLIILGNTGVGKSFLANVILDREAFTHKFSATSVTHKTTFEEIQVGTLMYAVFDIPGLIEADEERIQLNKEQIEKAFLLRPKSVILFVFGQSGGRIRDEDVVAFKALDSAYNFRQESLVLVVKTSPKEQMDDYECSVIVLFQQLLKGVEVKVDNVCFLDEIKKDDPLEKEALKERLLKVG
jgi:predicted GTPase